VPVGRACGVRSGYFTERSDSRRSRRGAQSSTTPAGPGGRARDSALLVVLVVSILISFARASDSVRGVSACPVTSATSQHDLLQTHVSRLRKRVGGSLFGRTNSNGLSASGWVHRLPGVTQVPGMTEVPGVMRVAGEHKTVPKSTPQMNDMGGRLLQPPAHIVLGQLPTSISGQVLDDNTRRRLRHRSCSMVIAADDGRHNRSGCGYSRDPQGGPRVTRRLAPVGMGLVFLLLGHARSYVRRPRSIACDLDAAAPQTSSSVFAVTSLRLIPCTSVGTLI
jgi:hypothetical protein